MMERINNFVDKYRLFLAAISLAIAAAMTPQFVNWIASDLISSIPEEGWFSPSTWGNAERVTSIKDSAGVLGQVGSAVCATLAAGIALAGFSLLRDRAAAAKTEAEEKKLRLAEAEQAAKTEAEEIEIRNKRIELLFKLDERVTALEEAAAPVVPEQIPPAVPAPAAHPRTKQQQTVTAP